MNKLEKLLHERGTKTLFMAHMITGFPNTAKSEAVARALIRGEADILEIQIPFSDPMADGPTIAVACEDALRAGMTVAKALAIVRSASKLGAPIAVMSYLNPVFRFGIERFVAAAQKAGADALIIPDCPFDTDEGRELLAACKAHDIALIPVVSPGVPEARLRALAKDARGFVYCTSRRGTTGANSSFERELKAYAATLKKIFNLPLGIGFGVKSRHDARDLSKIADIVIAGSVFVGAIREKSSVEKAMRSLKND